MSRRAWWWAGAVALAAILAALTWRPGATPGPTPAPGPGTAGEECPAGTREIPIYWLQADETGERVVAARRCAPAADPEAWARAAVEALAQGPDDAERARGLSSAVPTGTRLRGVRWERPYLHVDFTAPLQEVAGSAAVLGLVDQLAWTLTAIEGGGAVVVEEGRRVGTPEHPFSREGLLFDALRRPVEGLRGLTPAHALDAYIASIGDRERMWALMGPSARAAVGSPAGIEVEAWSEGLGAWRAYQVREQRVEGDRATVVIGGPQRLEGQLYPDARYTARLVRVDGIWRFDGGGGRLQVAAAVAGPRARRQHPVARGVEGFPPGGPRAPVVRA